MAQTDTALKIPDELKPTDGRFGSGPSRVRSEQIDALASPAGRALMGTSHRQKPVTEVVGRVRGGIRELFALPDGDEVALSGTPRRSGWSISALCT
jgi:phosphoserine aminotransferase